MRTNTARGEALPDAAGVAPIAPKDPGLSQVALIACAQVLLAHGGDRQLERAIEALLTATQATYVFVERNTHDPELGFCSQTVVEVEQIGTPGQELADEYWELVPWARMPTSRKHMERGEPFVLIPSELEGPEFEQYANDPFPVKCELDIPIFVQGEWAGLIGFADTSIVRDWTDEDIELLTAAATMVGAFWERQEQEQRLEHLVEAKDRFLAGISHELRNPLAVVSGLAELLREDDGSLAREDREEIVETLVRQAHDLTNIVSDLLVAARADLGDLPVTSVSLNLRAQAERVVSAMSISGGRAIELVGHAVHVVGDPERIRQILRNLLSNAGRYGGEHVRVVVKADPEWARVLVCDDGDPIPEADRERIFDAYQRAQDAKGVSGSSGIGLAVARQLARRMGGDLQYRHDGRESIFALSLRRAV